MSRAANNFQICFIVILVTYVDNLAFKVDNIITQLFFQL